MTGRRLLERLGSMGLRLRLRRGHLVVRGRPSPVGRHLISTYRDALILALEGRDRPLTDGVSPDYLHSLGLIEIGPGTWSHPLGDTHAERLICGDIPFDQARADVAADIDQRRREWGLHPKQQAEEVILRPGRHPGSFTFTIESGKRYR